MYISISREKRASSISKFPKQLRNQFVHDPRESLAYEWDNCRLLHPSSEILSLIRYSLFFSPSGSRCHGMKLFDRMESYSQFRNFLLPRRCSRAPDWPNNRHTSATCAPADSTDKTEWQLVPSSIPSGPFQTTRNKK